MRQVLHYGPKLVPDSCRTGPNTVKPSVLITRARPQAGNTAARVRALGFAPLEMPLTHIEPVGAGIEAVKSLTNNNKNVCIATSARALEVLAAAGLTGWMADQEWAVVGTRGGDLLESYGARLVAAPFADAKTMAKSLILRVGPMLYLAGVDRKANLEAAVPGLHTVEVYRAQALGGFSKTQTEALQASPPAFALLYSARSAHLLLQAVQDAELQHLFATTRCLCLSQDVAEALRALMSETYQIEVAETSDENALLSLLTSSH
ncbi:MAG: uroporphyrinogen-III synthase [Devosiaceae bacterium]